MAATKTPKNANNGVKKIQKGPKTIENDLKIARERSENCMFLDGCIALDRFETFGIIWNFLFPALVGILTWFTIQKQDFLIDKSKAFMELREKIPAKFRILVLFGFTLLLTYILMAIMPNKGTQFK